jgi:hypothetical protein
MCACVCTSLSPDQRTIRRNATPTVSALSSPSIFIMTVPNYGSCDLPQHGPDHGDIGQIPPWDQSSSPYTHSRGPWSRGQERELGRGESGR